MPRGIPNKKPEDALKPTAEEVTAAAAWLAGGNPSPLQPYEPHPDRLQPAEPVAEAPKLARVKLDRNYRPLNPFEVVGHHQPEIKRKDSAGRDVTIQEAAFIEGAPMPSAIAGTGFPNKVWAGTVIELPETEARAIVKQKIGSLEFAD
jgi:hypothetical protein